MKSNSTKYPLYMNNRTNKSLIFKILILFIGIYALLQAISFFYYGNNLFQIKYLAVNVLGNILLSFTIIYSFFNFKKSLILFYSLIPLNTWYKSVFFITYDFFTIDPFIILMLYFIIMLCYFLFKYNLKLNKIFFILMLLFLFRFIFGFFGVESYSDIYFIINELFEPFLFLAITTFSYSLFKREIVSFFESSVKGLLATSFIILLTEMILRSNGKPWLFLLYGGRKGYTGTSGDLTAGLGEPVTMGLFATFLFFYFFFFNRKRLILFYLFFLMLSSIAKSAIFAFVLIFILIYSSIRNKIWKLISKKYALLAGLISIPLLGMVFKRLMGVGKIDTITTMSIGGIEISSDVNLIRNISSAINWADPYLNIDWYYQFLLLPFVGGINNVVYIEKYYFVFIIGIIILFTIIYYFIIKGNFFTRSVTIVLLLVYCYYGAFGGNPFSYFYEIDREPSLGYVPRSEPTYLMIILLFLIEISKYKYSDLKYFLRGKNA